MKVKRKVRLIVQAATAVISNGYAAGFMQSKIYTGPLKRICFPGLNCHSCPGALFACPLGSLQAAFAGSGNTFLLYTLGFLFLFGAAAGRFICGWLCPFGLIQDLLYKIKIPFVKKLRGLPGEKLLRIIRYPALAVLCIILPAAVTNIVGLGTPWFCKLICPAGTLEAGVPFVVFADGFAEAAGAIFAVKCAVLAAIVILSVIIYRPFCRYLCPLGAVYGLFNPISLYSYRVDNSKCTGCGACEKVCRLNIAAFKTPNSVDCIRCGECLRACPESALSAGLRKEKTLHKIKK